MCLIALAWKVHPRYRLALIANRDEFHARPAAPAQAHSDAPQVFGGRDIEKGGSWLLASRVGRVAAVTNVRVGLSPSPVPRSRGSLVDGFAKSSQSPEEFLAGLSAHAAEYGRFNLVIGDGDSLLFASNHPEFRWQPIPPGLQALSNGDLNAPWPKVERARQALGQWLEATPVPSSAGPGVTALFDALADPRVAADDTLPDTGVGLERERMLSAPFVVGPIYGTRASTVLLMGTDSLWLAERSFAANGVFAGEQVLGIP